MTQEDKELLLVDLCARLPYTPKGIYSLKCDSMHPITFDHLTTRYIDRFTTEQPSYTDEIVDIKLYLRPMSSMTEEEKREVEDLSKRWIESTGIFIWPNEGNNVLRWNTIEVVLDWLNAHHFDHRGLIEKGLALEAPEDMYK